MSLRKAVILSIVFLALLLFVNEYEIPHEAAKAKEGLFLPEVNGASDLKEVVIQGPKGEFTLVNSQVGQQAEDNSSGDWRLSGLPRAELEQGAVSTLVTTLIGLKLTDPIPADDLSSDLSIYGLTSPVVKVKVVTSKGERSLHLGKRSDYLMKRYAKVPEEKDVYLLLDQLYSALDKNEKDWRDKTPLKYQEGDLSRFSYQLGEKQVIVEAKEKGGWTLIDPYPSKVKQASIAEIFRGLRSLTVDQFIQEPEKHLAEYHLNAPSVKVTLTKKKGEESQLLFSPSDDGTALYIFEVGGDSIFKVLGNPLNTLFPPVESLVEKKLTSLSFYEVSELTVWQGEKKLAKLVKKGDKEWSINDQAADNAAVESYLHNFFETQSVAFPGPGEEVKIDPVEVKFEIKPQVGEAVIYKIGPLIEKAGVNARGVIVNEEEKSFIADDTVKRLIPSVDALKAVPTPVPTATSVSEAQPG